MAARGNNAWSVLTRVAAAQQQQQQQQAASPNSGTKAPAGLPTSPGAPSSVPAQVTTLQGLHQVATGLRGVPLQMAWSAGNGRQVHRLPAHQLVYAGAGQVPPHLVPGAAPFGFYPQAVQPGQTQMHAATQNEATSQGRNARQKGSTPLAASGSHASPTGIMASPGSISFGTSMALAKSSSTIVVDVVIPGAKGKGKNKGDLVNYLRVHAVADTNIADVKRLIKRNWGVPICQQQLALRPGSKALSDSATCSTMLGASSSGSTKKHGSSSSSEPRSGPSSPTRSGNGVLDLARKREAKEGARVVQTLTAERGSLELAGHGVDLMLFFKHLAPPTVIRRWTQKEDQLLFQAIAKFGEKDWESVARHVGTRKGLRCRQRWMNTLKPGHVKGKWTTDDDAQLVSLVKREEATRGKGHIKWSVVASQIEGRNIKQVKERWSNYLDPNVRKDDFTPEEDAFLVAKKEAGMGWSAIAKLLKTRVANQLKNRYGLSLPSPGVIGMLVGSLHA
eukprot:INCI5597.2.p1 GENE.INCI5597.2~~INCI5597.2.p1  ORF type:complete len:505 (-),score=82.62 INCI5597.2:1113-2627(-)